MLFCAFCRDHSIRQEGCKHDDQRSGIIFGKKGKIRSVTNELKESKFPLILSTLLALRGRIDISYQFRVARDVAPGSSGFSDHQFVRVVCFQNDDTTGAALGVVPMVLAGSACSSSPPSRCNLAAFHLSERTTK